MSNAVHNCLVKFLNATYWDRHFRRDAQWDGSGSLTAVQDIPLTKIGEMYLQDLPQEAEGQLFLHWLDRNWDRLDPAERGEIRPLNRFKQMLYGEMRTNDGIIPAKVGGSRS